MLLSKWEGEPVLEAETLDGPPHTKIVERVLAHEIELALDAPAVHVHAKAR